MAEHRVTHAAPVLAQRRVDAFVRATFDGIISDLERATSNRQAELLRASQRSGALVRYDLLTAAEAEDRLLAGATSNGYVAKDGEREARGTVRRGLRWGIEHATLPADIVEAAQIARWGQPDNCKCDVCTSTRRAAKPATAPVLALDDARTYPPIGEVARLWRLARPVDEDAEARAYLLSRGIDPIKVSERNLARAVPPDAPPPRWAETWTRHRLLVPMFDDCGVMRSVLGRDVTREAKRKSLAPTGHRRAGLVFAEGLGRRMLDALGGVRSGCADFGHSLPEVPARSERVPRGAVRRVIVTEGEIDFLTAAAELGDADDDTAVLGIASGSWTPQIASKVPDGAELVIATDHDEPGEKYAAQIVDSFAGREVALLRWGAL